MLLNRLCYKKCNISCFLIYNVDTMFKTICISSFRILKILKMYVKIHNTGQQISNKKNSVMNMLLIYLFASVKFEKRHKKYQF